MIPSAAYSNSDTGALPLQVGITGGIGTGKSLVSRIFNVLGVPVYDADTSAKELYVTDPGLKAEVIHNFGPAGYLPNGNPDRAYLAAQIFNNPERKALLNSLVHPRVGQNYRDWASANRQAAYTLKEAAIMFESGSYKMLDLVIGVSAPHDLRIQRVLARDSRRTEADVKAIIANQMPDEELLRRADFIIYNNEQQSVLQQVLKLDKLLRQKAHQHRQQNI
ncbi:MAG: dephospho-CoA kinase [Bacteroidota bacterium]